jgi:hypothetical protein
MFETDGSGEYRVLSGRKIIELGVRLLYQPRFLFDVVES